MPAYDLRHLAESFVIFVPFVVGSYPKSACQVLTHQVTNLTSGIAHSAC